MGTTQVMSAAKAGQTLTRARAQLPTLGLGVQELSIAEGTGAHVLVGGNSAAPALQERHSPLDRAAAAHVGKSPDCSRLGLGVLEI